MKIKTLLFTTLALLSLGGNSQAQETTKTEKALVVYFSLSGNTQEIANKIKNITNADLFEIVPLEAYPEDYRATTKQAKKEISEGYKPALKNKLENIQDYGIIYVGSPCWWSTIAPPVATFLSEYDLSGKTIIPFMTHGGSGLGHSVEDIKKLLPNSTVTDGKAFWGKSAKDANEDVAEWLKGLK